MSNTDKIKTIVVIAIPVIFIAIAVVTYVKLTNKFANTDFSKVDRIIIVE